jgi:UPF0716 protein FxsA
VRFLFLAFIIIPVLEMWVLIRVGSVIGAWPTIALVLLTAMIGVALLRREGLKTLTKGTAKLDRGEMPAQEVAEGLVLAVSGALLLTPGFFTDFVGLVGLIPWTRRWLIRRGLASGRVVQSGFVASRYQSSRPSDDDKVIEAEFWQEEKNKPDT